MLKFRNAHQVGASEASSAWVTEALEANSLLAGLLGDEVCDLMIVNEAMRPDRPCIEPGCSQETVEDLVMIREGIIKAIAINAVVAEEANFDQVAGTQSWWRVRLANIEV